MVSKNQMCETLHEVGKMVRRWYKHWGRHELQNRGSTNRVLCQKKDVEMDLAMRAMS